MQPLQADFTTFVKGFVTEANPLSFPDNAALIDTNFVLNIDGSRNRRLGMDYEDDYSLVPTGVPITDKNIAITSHIWHAVANRGDLEFGVIQIGTSLYFFSTKNGNISNSKVNKGNAITIIGDKNTPISGTSIHGRFVVANGEQSVTILSYDTLTDTVSSVTKRITIRDLFGIDDGLSIDEKPTTLATAHRYNLRNQGWPTSFSTSNDSIGSDFDNRDPIEYTKLRLGRYPSNSEIIWSAKLSAAKEANTVNSFSPWDLNKTQFGNTPAPRGSFIIDIFNRGASRKNFGFVDIPDDKSEGGIIAVSTFAGRVFYAVKETAFSNGDSKSPNIGTMIFFSRSSNSIEDWVKCHAEADPTAEHVFDPIATDGGFITIPEMGQVINMKSKGQSLFVFATNGVWEIHGGENPFSATNQEVNKTTNIGAVNRDCIIYAEDKICYWGRSGIYMITSDAITLRGSNNDLTFTTIQSFFDNIEISIKEKAIGTYDQYTRTFRWLFSEQDERFYNKELVYDVKLEAFYLNEIKSNSTTPWVAGYMTIADPIYFTTYNKVVLGSNDVVVVSSPDTLNVITFSHTPDEKALGSTKYLTIIEDSGEYKLTFSHYRNINFLDWYSHNGIGIDANATLLTGYITAGTPISGKEIGYITTYFKRTESGFNPDGSVIDPSSCTIQTQWDWTNSPGQGRWGREFEAYRLPRMFMMLTPEDGFDYGYTTVVTKNKLRGHGRALSILFKTKPGHNLHIYGWSIVGGSVLK